MRERRGSRETRLRLEGTSLSSAEPENSLTPFLCHLPSLPSLPHKKSGTLETSSAFLCLKFYLDLKNYYMGVEKGWAPTALFCQWELRGQVCGLHGVSAVGCPEVCSVGPV